jgi:hypothetical protein
MNTIYHHEDQPQFNGEHTLIQETIKYTNIGFLDLSNQQWILFYVKIDFWTWYLLISTIK